MIFFYMVINFQYFFCAKKSVGDGKQDYSCQVAINKKYKAAVTSK